MFLMFKRNCEDGFIKSWVNPKSRDLSAESKKSSSGMAINRHSF